MRNFRPACIGLALVLAGIVGCFMPGVGHSGECVKSGVDFCKAHPWGGIYPTVLIPWCCDGGVDEIALADQIEFQIKGGVHGLLVLGTIGEGEYADMQERAQVIQVAVETAAGCVPVVVGIHTANLEKAILQLHQARDLGADAVLVKYLGNPDFTFDDVLGFYAALAELRLLPIFYYHYPSQTGVALPPVQIAEILSLDGVVGIKESTLNLNEMQQHIELARGLGKVFLTSTALHLTQFLDIGGHGAMCPEAVLMPRTAVRVYRTYAQGHRKTSRIVQEELFAVAPVYRGRLTSERSARRITTFTQDLHIPMPIGRSQPQARMKAALDGMGIRTSAEVKPPLAPLSVQDRIKVKRAVPKIRRIEGCGDSCLDKSRVQPR